MQIATGSPAHVTRNGRPDVTEYNFDATGGHVMSLWWDDQPGVVPGWVLEDCQGCQQQVGEGWAEEEGERLARAFLAAGVTSATLSAALMGREDLEGLLGELTSKQAALIQAQAQGWDWSDEADHEPIWKINLSEVDGEFFLVEVGDSTSITSLGTCPETARAALAARIEEAASDLASSLAL